MTWPTQVCPTSSSGRALDAGLDAEHRALTRMPHHHNVVRLLAARTCRVAAELASHAKSALFAHCTSANPTLELVLLCVCFVASFGASLLITLVRRDPQCPVGMETILRNTVCVSLSCFVLLCAARFLFALSRRLAPQSRECSATCCRYGCVCNLDVACHRAAFAVLCFVVADCSCSLTGGSALVVVSSRPTVSQP